MPIEVTDISFKNPLDSTPVNWLLANLDDDIEITHSIDVRTFTMGNSEVGITMNHTNGYLLPGVLSHFNFTMFKVGDVVQIYNYFDGSNYGNYTIVEIISNTAIRLNTAVTGITPTTDNNTWNQIVISLVKPITALAYKWNFIKNTEAANFFSKIDGSVQQASITGLNPAGGGTNLPMNMMGQSAYQLGEITVEEVGLTLTPIYTSKFKIKHKTKLINVVDIDKLADFQAGIAPDEFFNLDCLKAIFYYEARYLVNDPNNPQTKQLETLLGNTGWINENWNANPTNYSVSNLQYKYTVSGIDTYIPAVELSTTRSTVFQFDIENTTDSPFVAGQTKVALNFKKVPGDLGEYTNNGRDYKHNFCHEQALLTVQTIPVAINGDNYADLSIRSLRNLKAYFVSPSKITVVGSFFFNQQCIDVFEESNEPSYIFLASVQDHTKNGAISDRVTLRVDANNNWYQTSFPNLIDMDSKLIPHDCPDYVTGFIEDREKFTEDELVGYTKVHLNRDPAVGAVEFLKYTAILSMVNTASGAEFIVESKSINLPSFGNSPTVPNFNVSQNRPFHIPLTEIRKVILARNNSLIGANNYEFAYPFLNRWEYWEPLLNAHASFFNNTQPNDGKNHDWQHYMGNFWTARYRFELNTKINGVPALYTDYLDFNILNRNLPAENTTCVITAYDPDTLTPLVDGFGTKYLLGYKNTLIEVVFTNTIDGYPSRPDIFVVIGIEAKEIGGYYGKRRMSSKYDSDSDTWFIPLTGETRVKLVKTGTTATATVLVDYTGIGNTIQNWKITARIYGNDVSLTPTTNIVYGQNYLGSQDFGLIPNNPVDEQTEVLKPEQLDCCGDLVWKVLADAATNDPLKNDVNNFIQWYDKTGVVGVTCYLNKSDGTRISLTSNNAYGTAYNYGFDIMPNVNVNGNGEKAVGYFIEWKKVMAALGEGVYFIEWKATDLFGVEFYKYSPAYCLKQYTLERANGTVRLEYYLNGVVGKTDNDKKTRDYLQSNWYNQHRFDGYFYYTNSNYEVKEIQYQNGFIDEVEHGQTPEYLLKLKPIPFYKHDIIRTDILMSNKILVTDYNTKNIDNYHQKEVKKNGNYEPVVHPMQRKVASVDIKFKQAFNNLNKYIS